MNTVVALPGRPLATLTDNTTDFFNGVFNASALKQRNDYLESQLKVFNLYETTVRDRDLEIQNLRALLDMPVPEGVTRLAAPVWGYFPAENRLTIGAGSKQGARVGSAVVSPEGLVGVVQTVARDTAQVQLVTSPSPFKIGARVQGKATTAGLLHGEALDRLKLELTTPDLQIAQGDLVETSGFSEMIPGGIPIGKVVQVIDSREYGIKGAQVFPFVRFDTLRNVVVLR